MERNVTIKGEVLLEGRLSLGKRDEGWIICHPHPQLGGSMTNNVVFALANAFSEEKFSYLRFNFRGVGASAGRYSGGSGEINDVIAAFNFMKRHVKAVGIAGYSFGAWVGLSALEEVDAPCGYIAVAPPLRIFEFPEITQKDIPVLAICGSGDPFSPPEVVKAWALVFRRSEVSVIEGADHIFWGYEDELKEKVITWLRKTYGS